MSTISKQPHNLKVSHRERVLTNPDVPPKISVVAEDVAESLTKLPRWVCWRWERCNGKKWTKVPYRTNGRSKASTSDPKSWSTFNEARDAWKKDKSLGIGFVFNGDGIVGVDIDDCRDPETGTIADWAQEIIDHLGSYAEVSPSGTGVKVFIRGELPAERGRKFSHSSGGALEVYATGRFFVVTGQHIEGTPVELKRRPKSLLALVEKAQSWKQETKRNEPPKSGLKTTLIDVHSSDRDTALAALRVLDPDMGYGEWLRVGMALHSVDTSDGMCAEFDLWSQGSSKYVAGEPAEKWNSFSSNSGVTIGTLCHLADETKKPWRLNEATDDPHRLARIFLLQKGTTSTGERNLYYWRGTWWRWDKAAYTSVSKDDLTAELMDTIKCEVNRAAMARHVTDETKSTTVTKVTRALVDNVKLALQATANLPGKVQRPAWLDPTKASDPPPEFCLSTRTELLHLTKAGIQTLPATPRFFSANAVDYVYDPKAKCPQWREFLNSLFPEDPDSTHALQEWFGYLLLPDTIQQKLLMIVGPPRAGKGTITKILGLLIGSTNVATPTLASLGEPFGLQSLIDKTVAIIGDARLSARADTVAVVERLLSISGADALDIQRKHLETLTGVRLPIRFVILTNELPNLKDAAAAITSRIIILRLKESFIGREDQELATRLATEMSGILNWALEGWRRLKRRGKFVQPPSGCELLNDLGDLASPTKQFLDDRCDLGAGHSISCAALFSAWQAWCEKNGRDYPGTSQTFGRDLRAALPNLEMVKGNVNGKRTRKYVGVRLQKGGTHRDADQTVASIVKRVKKNEGRERT